VKTINFHSEEIGDRDLLRINTDFGTVTIHLGLKNDAGSPVTLVEITPNKEAVLIGYGNNYFVYPKSKLKRRAKK